MSALALLAFGLLSLLLLDTFAWGGTYRRSFRVTISTNADALRQWSERPWY